MTATLPDRRRVVAALGAALAAAAAPALARGHDDAPLAALLLPATGPHADLARSLDHAATLALPDGARLLRLDAGTTPAAAAAAAREAARRGAPVIIGPLFSAQVAAVVGAAGGVPVLALADDGRDAAGAFVLGVTAEQAVAAILDYARARGVRRVAIAPGTTAWDQAAQAAAQVAARALGLAIGDSAEALLVTGGATALAAAARRVDGQDVQLLATHQVLAGANDGLAGGGLAAAEGAWLAAPDPDGFGDFARRFEARFGNPPGLLAGLAYDAAAIARRLRAGGFGRDGLSASAGFPGVTGAVRFAADGRATRELAILVVAGGGVRAVGEGR